MEYLINVAFTFSAFLPFLLLLALAIILLRPLAGVVTQDEELTEKIAKRRGAVAISAGILALFFILFSAIQPSNTYKHTGYNREADDRRLKQVIEQQTNAALEIQDRTRQPDLTREERQQHFEKLVDRSRFTKE